MAKRGAEFQMAKEGGGGPDFRFGASPADAGPIQPQRATAQQMAKRKIATGRKSRVASSSIGTAPQQSPTFSLPSTQDNSWTGSFGNTSTSFSAGSDQSASNSEQPSFNFSSSFTQNSAADSQSKPSFASFGQSSSFGSAPSTAATNNTNTTASSNLFSFGANASNSFPPDKSTTPTNIFQTQGQNQPTVNGFGSTGQSNVFQSQPATNGFQPSKPSPTFSFPSSNSSSAPSFTTSAPAKPSNPFQSTQPQASATSLFSPSPATAAPSNPEEQTLTSEQVSQTKEFLSQIEAKFQNMDNFRKEAQKQVESMPDFSSANSGEVVAAFVAELSRIQPAVNSFAAGAGPTVKTTVRCAKVLFAMIEKHLNAHERRVSSPFSTKPQENSASFKPFTSSAGPAGNQFSTQNPTISAVPSAKPNLDAPALRDMLRNEAKQQLPILLQGSSPTIDGNRIVGMIPDLFSKSFSDLQTSQVPPDVDISLLRDAIKDGVIQAFAQMRAQNGSSTLNESAVQDLFTQAFRNALPNIQSAVEIATTRVYREGVPTVDEALNQLRYIKSQCEKATPPTVISVAPYSVEKLDPTQREQFAGGWKIKLFAGAAEDIIQQFKMDPVATSRLVAEFSNLKYELAALHGIKRKTAPDSSISQNGPNKRPNFGTSTPASASDKGSLFATPTNEKRAAESDEISPAAKRARDDSTAGPISSGSQTSNLFAQLAQAPQGESTPQSSSTQNMFAKSTSNKTASESSASAATVKPPQFNVAPASSGSNFFAQFNKKAAATAEQEKAKRKAEDYDSEEETEEEWEKRDAAEQLAKRQKLMSGVKSTGFVPSADKKPSSEASREDEADNEDSTEEPSPEGASKAADSSSTNAASTPSGSGSRSLFDRVQDGKDAPSPTAAPNGDKTWKPDSPIRFGAPTSTNLFPGATQVIPSPQAKAGSGDVNSSKTLFGSTTPAASQGTSIFGAKPSTTLFGAKTNATGPTNPFAQTPAKDTTKETGASPAPTFNFTAASPQKTPVEKSKNLFQFPTTPTTGKEPAKSLFDTANKPASSTPFSNPFAHLSETPSVFATPPAASASGGLAPTSVFATAGSSRATSPGMTTGDESTGSAAGEEPAKDPQLDLSEARAGEENETTLLELKSKASELAPKDDGEEGGEREWKVRGVGQLRLLKHKETGKVRLVLRALPSSRVVLNVALMSSTTYSCPTAKSVAFVASNAGSVARWTLQVGKAEDAEKLRDMLEKHKHD